MRLSREPKHIPLSSLSPCTAATFSSEIWSWVWKELGRNAFLLREDVTDSSLPLSGIWASEVQGSGQQKVCLL